MAKDSDDAKPKKPAPKNSKNSSTLTPEEKRMKENILLKKLFKVTRPMAPDKK